jgi:hypothetical protein
MPCRERRALLADETVLTVVRAARPLGSPVDLGAGLVHAP